MREGGGGEGGEGGGSEERSRAPDADKQEQGGGHCAVRLEQRWGEHINGVGS